MQKHLNIVVDIGGKIGTTIIRNVWHFLYRESDRTLLLKGYRKIYREEVDNTWSKDTVFKAPFDIEKEIPIIQGSDYDWKKVLHIAKAKVLQSDIMMRYNEVDCISVEYYDPAIHGEEI